MKNDQPQCIPKSVLNLNALPYISSHERTVRRSVVIYPLNLRSYGVLSKKYT